ncbi:hypothetical protein DID88_003421 [Monilinia fructigena]|uniref:F-BAR domain-containing protein n=1 Tax=Monilinia fructigena TaxID=38457 RepID=A0A395IUS4_9HELO|nr:hypothetical protein DID88_003421 [Monilinia fructigena]
MPGTISDGPSVTMSFANNFWGKDDAGVEPLIQRMVHAKQTCDELKSFYNGMFTSNGHWDLKSQELFANLWMFLKGEVEAMGKAHQTIAGQMRTELEEPLAAFAGAMKERRKIVQHGTEKLLKIKVQQTNQVNKTRDKYEQECLKIKGYLAQGHMVMGQEERKNKAKLEKTQVNLATSNTEDWKSAADKFQDLEEERLDFMKSSLWSFANIASTVCVSDDASCEKVRLALEECEVEKDIMSFINECGTGQEIPDPPKYINFCRGDADSQSEASEDDAYSVAQFQRTINPAYRSSSPQPSTYESHHDPQSALAKELAHEVETPKARETTGTPQKLTPSKSTPDRSDMPKSRTTNQNLLYRPHRPKWSIKQPARPRAQSQATWRQARQQPPHDYQQAERQRQQQAHMNHQQTERQKQAQAQAQAHAQAQANYRQQERRKQAQLEYQPQILQQPQVDYQRPESSRLPKMDWSKPIQMPYEQQQGPPSALSDMSSAANSPVRPSSRDSQSDYSNPTSFSSQEPPSGKKFSS